MGSAGRAGPWIRAASKGFGYITSPPFLPRVQRPVTGGYRVALPIRWLRTGRAIKDEQRKEDRLTQVGRRYGNWESVPSWPIRPKP